MLTGLATLAHENAALFLLPLGVAAWSVAAGPRPGWAGAESRAGRDCAPLAAPALLVALRVR